MGALDGMTVVDCSTGAAAALATMFMSDHGARVIRVIEPDTDPLREGGFVVWDRGKHNTALDLAAVSDGLDTPSTTSAVSDWRVLLQTADVVIDDLTPDDPKQALFEWPRLQAINPRLVHCAITAFGKHGPLRNAPAIEDLVLARMGVLGGMPGYRPAPVHVVHPLPTVGAALFANIGVAAALFARETTGRGRAVSTSLMAGALLYHPKVTGEHIPRHVFQTHPAGSAPYYSVYQCQDGAWLQFGCVRAGFVTKAAEIMGIGALLAEPRFANRPAGLAPEDDAELRHTITRIMRTRPFAEWAALFEAADVPFAESRLTADGLHDPQVRHNFMVLTLADPREGPVTQMGVPLNMSATPGAVQSPRRAEIDAIADLCPNPDPQLAETLTQQTGMDPPPLAGIKVLEITNLIAGPTGGRLLADLGADVIKLEPPGGDLSRPIGRTYFYNVNFNKRSIAINTASAEGKSIVQRLAHQCDALLANLRPGATERMGITSESHPHLIETHLTGYGFTGPYSHRPGIDPLAQALMGLERAQGGPDNPPVFPAELAPTDYTTGAMGTLGTIFALLQRRRRAIVQRVESNLLNGAAVLSSAWFTDYANRPDRPLADRAQYGLSPYHRLYRVRDGWLYVAADTMHSQQALLAFTGQTPSQPVPGQHPNETPLAEAMAEKFAALSLQDALRKMTQLGIPALEATAGDSEIFLDDPHSAANNMVIDRLHAKAGKLRVAWNYIQFNKTTLSAGCPTPLLGQNSKDILTELGYGDDEIARLFGAGIVLSEQESQVKS